MQSNRLRIISLLVLIIILSTVAVFAQCPMCKMAAETNMKNGGTEGKGLNAGILYLLSLPYLMISILGYVWWKKRKQQKELNFPK